MAGIHWVHLSFLSRVVGRELFVWGDVLPAELANLICAQDCLYRPSW